MSINLSSMRNYKNLMFLLVSTTVALAFVNSGVFNDDDNLVNNSKIFN